MTATQRGGPRNEPPTLPGRRGVGGGEAGRGSMSRQESRRWCRGEIESGRPGTGMWRGRREKLGTGIGRGSSLRRSELNSFGGVLC